MINLAVLFQTKGRGLIALWIVAFSGLGDADMIDTTGMQAWEVCALCHSANGISRMPKFPKLAGQKAVYIEQQVTAFRAGRRHNDGGQMQSIVGEIAEEDIADIAAYFSSLPADTEAGMTEQAPGKWQTEQLSLGQTLFDNGRKGITPCADCHAHKDSSAPWLDGQHREYLQKQLQDFKAGERAADCPVAKAEFESLTSNEKRVSEQLEDSEIEALARYLNTLMLSRKMP